MKNIIILLFCSVLNSYGQQDSIFIRHLFDEALTNGKAYVDLRELCKQIGPRLSGSPEAEMAIQWGEQKLKQYQFDRVYLQPIEIPHWERGTKESGWVIRSSNEIIKLNPLALGGSIATNGKIEAELIVFSSLEALKQAKRKEVAGKIVLLNQAMTPTQIDAFKSYGGCYDIRTDGPVEAAKLGAIGLFIRSISLSENEHPHTGTLHYEDSIPKIPAAALSTNEATYLAKLATKENVKIAFELNCVNYPDKASANVIAEITGSKYPKKIITIGAHLDSWDVGEGAHDDGTGIAHVMEALRLLKISNYRPTHTIRVVFFMNEENGNKGGKTYATWCKSNGEEQIAAIESDRGGFSPRGFHCDGTPEQLALLQSFSNLLKPYELHHFEKGYGGVDISPLKKEYPSIPLFGFIPDSQRYFEYHHAASDVFESVNERELALGCASIAALVYLLDQQLS